MLSRYRGTLLAAVVVVVILIMVLFAARAHHAERKEMLEGFWEASPEFAKTGGLGEMFIYLTRSGRAYDGHIFMSDAQGNTISNQSFTMKPSAGWALNSVKGCFARGPSRCKVEFEFDEEDFAMPDRMQMALGSDGSLTLHDSEKIYAHLFRNNALSAED